MNERSSYSIKNSLYANLLNESFSAKLDCSISIVLKSLREVSFLTIITNFLLSNKGAELRVCLINVWSSGCCFTRNLSTGNNTFLRFARIFSYRALIMLESPRAIFLLRSNTHFVHEFIHTGDFLIQRQLSITLKTFEDCFLLSTQFIHKNW